MLYEVITIHCGDKHEVRRVFDAGFRTRDGDHAFFERLAQHFEHVARELREFVEKKHAVMRETDFTGTRVADTTADQRRVGDRMMRRTERPRGDDRRPGRKQSDDRMDFRCLQRLV